LQGKNNKRSLSMLSCSNELEVGMETSPMLAVYFEADAFAGLSESVP